MNGMIDVQVSLQEFATIIAALRFYQAAINRVNVDDIATDGGTFEPLGDDGIDELVERINIESEEDHSPDIHEAWRETFADMGLGDDGSPLEEA